MTKSHTEHSPRAARTRIAHSIAIALFAACATGNALAFQLDTSYNPDLSVRLDHDHPLQLMRFCTEARDSKIGNDVIADEGDYSFNKGDAVVAKRLDLLTELRHRLARNATACAVAIPAGKDGAYGDKSQVQP